MKSINRKIHFAVALSICLSFQAFAQSHGEKEYVYMKITEGSVEKSSRIVIAYPNGNIKSINLETIADKFAESNARVIAKTINEMAENGYKLVLGSGGEYYTRYVFLKREGKQ